MNKPAKAIFLVVAIVVIAYASINLLPPGLAPNAQKTVDLDYSQLQDRITGKDGQARIQTAVWQQSRMTGTLADGRKFEAQVPEQNTQLGAQLAEALNKSGISYKLEPAPVSASIVTLLGVLIFPAVILLLFYLFVLRPAQMGGNQAMSFGRSRARRVGETNPKVTFDDVAGIDEAKTELFEIVDFLKNTKKYAALGAKIPKGILLTGPPGVGKTHLARAIAGEAGVPFFHISGSDFVEMFVGVGAARVRDLFETAKAHRPSLIFIDEIDAVGRQRGAGLGGGHDEREQTLNQMLVEMDGFDPNSGVILIAATNRPDVLDPALLRPGRFDRQIVIDVPDAVGREAILKIHAKGKPLEAGIDLGTLGKRTPGFTGADLANMLNEGALLAARRGHARVQQDDLEEALDRVIAGPQRKSRVIDAKEREVIAYHEAGHAVVSEKLEHCDPVHKVTILPRGMSLGATWNIPETDKHLVSRDELHDDITALLGGRVSEELVFNQVTTGASNDLERVTRIARAMVCEFGMSEKLGTLAIGRRSHNPFLGRDYNDERNYSEDVAKMIDDEVRAIVDKCHSRARETLLQSREQLDAVVLALLERETLNREDFLAVMAGQPLGAAIPTGQAEAAGETTEQPAGEKEKKQPSRTPPRLEPGPA
ncbi:MAG: ATP-dependent metallopeptidase FtsH/Yme1/Tma family protein [Fimbriimonas ginsengisoli]|uniref:ATP-dependent zinc metalloprotease FtsH n=1 Tax=Fimbriimonas ginsengisoli TaxID=1005039 RepID=A0A931PWP9_FIMGI|nr:ATP-dependent metallopeptidase FtsH/Yme1/Tma family protein [Fimbriimonas ginsengisoli]